jgi:hypothetical protein
MTKRIVDINGEIMYLPKGYGEALNAARNMIDGMESDKVDRSDMAVVLATLMTELNFHLNIYLPKRS